MCSSFLYVFEEGLMFVSMEAGEKVRRTMRMARGRCGS